MEEIDCEYTDEIVCPYCGCEFSDSWEVGCDSGTLECGWCGEEFEYECNISITYSTWKAK